VVPPGVQSFALNPFLDKDREPKTWLSEGTGPIESRGRLLTHSVQFHLGESAAMQILAAEAIAQTQVTD